MWLKFGKVADGDKDTGKVTNTGRFGEAAQGQMVDGEVVMMNKSMVMRLIGRRNLEGFKRYYQRKNKNVARVCGTREREVIEKFISNQMGKQHSTVNRVDS